MFDRAEVLVKAGNGGNGVVSFRREKWVPFGGPDGGDGGNGGDVIVRADSAVTNLKIFNKRRYYRAANGEDGRGKKQHGKKGENLILAVPVGTVVSHKSQIGEDTLIADLEQNNVPAVVARGGKGGLGNARFATSTDQAPQIAQNGEYGEENSIILELKLIADVGIIGYPNVGKSTLLAAISAAKPEIAGYPFTTREPVLGVVEVGQRTFVLAEIPGLIDGAHLGRGLGHDFLRHIVRTKILIHLIDGSSSSPVEDMVRVNSELSLFDSALAQKPQLVAVNKIDLPDVRARLDEIRDIFASAGTRTLFVSAATGEGTPELIAETMKMLESSTETGAGGKILRKVFHPQPRDVAPRVHKEGDIFVVTAPELERIVVRKDVADSGVRRELRRKFARLGVSKALERAGVKPGDRVRCGNLEWTWE